MNASTLTAASLAVLSSTHAFGSYEVGPDGSAYALDADSVAALLDETVHVVSVSAGESDDSVDADLVVRVADEWVDCSVTLYRDRGRPTVGRKHPLSTCGTPLYGWADDRLCQALADAEANDEDYDPRDLVAEIEHAVNEAACKAGI